MAIICVLIGVILKKTKHETKSKPLSRPWVDEDLKDGTDNQLEEEGKRNPIHLNTFVVYILSANTSKVNVIFWTFCTMIAMHCTTLLPCSELVSSLKRGSSHVKSVLV